MKVKEWLNRQGNGDAYTRWFDEGELEAEFEAYANQRVIEEFDKMRYAVCNVDDYVVKRIEELKQ